MYKKLLPILFLALLLWSCEQGEVDFNYTPEAPKAGQTIRFTNLTQSGEDWEWQFGDGTSSTLKSPTKVYKRAGTYTIVLRVDDKNSRTCTKTIVVSDTLPSLQLQEDSVRYFSPVHLSLSLYNPYNHACTYQWHLGKDIRILQGDTTKSAIEVLFLRHSEPVRVGCTYTLNGTAITMDTAFYVHDQAAPSLCIYGNGGTYRQRIYALGEEEPLSASLPALSGQDEMTYNGTTYRITPDGLLRVIAGDETLLIPGTIDAFQLDGIARKLYYIADGGLYVANLSGTQRVRLSDANGTGLLVENSSNRLYWSAPMGVCYLPLVQTANNSLVALPSVINNLNDITALRYDSQLR